MNAAIVCVDFADLLAVTLEYNRHHFRKVLVVTSRSDSATAGVAARLDSQVHATDAFYANGADFNKWLALEEALAACNFRHGKLALVDADILWPKHAPLDVAPGTLVSPLRHLFEDLSKPIPSESQWSNLPIHRNVGEWAGYSQIFYCDDPVLGPAPWHEIDWRHAGGADSFFQAKWPRERKIRPGWNCLHLGPAGQNWCGRVTPYLGGERPEEAEDRQRKLSGYWTGRRMSGSFAGEKITPE